MGENAQAPSSSIELVIGETRIRVSGSESFVAKQFNAILERLLAGDFRQSLGFDVGAKGVPAGTEASLGSKELTIDWTEELSKEVGANPHDLRQLFEERDEILHLKSWPSSGSVADRQREITLVTLLANKRAGNESVKASVMAEVVGNLGVSMKNYARNIKSARTEVVPRGRGTATSYAILLSGQEAAKEFLKSFFGKGK